MNARRAAHYLAWARPYFDRVRGNVGYVGGRVLHLWHGDFKDRQLAARHERLKEFDFDPFDDVALDANGCWRWNSDKPAMHQWVRRYFESRNEDGEHTANQLLDRFQPRAVDPFTRNTLYAGETDGVFKSTDGSESWIALNNGFTNTYVNSLVLDPAQPTTLYAGTHSGVFSISQIGVACVGDCNNDTSVTVDEILTMVNIALGNASVSTCLAGDANHDNEITIDEILAAVNNALNGCP